MKTLLTEMPWRELNINCPNCKRFIETYDWVVELWEQDQNSKNDLKKIIINKLMKQNLLPVICPYCKTYFITNIETHVATIKVPPKIFKRNQNVIVNTFRNRHLSFKEFHENILHEAKCNNCGECCKEKIIKEGKYYATDKYCPAYDIGNKRCSIYETRLTEAKQRFGVNCCTVEESIASGQHPEACPYVSNDYKCICEHISTLS